jgi:hypothetical protein
LLQNDIHSKLKGGGPNVNKETGYHCSVFSLFRNLSTSLALLLNYQGKKEYKVVPRRMLKDNYELLHYQVHVPVTVSKKLRGVLLHALQTMLN